MQRTLLLSSWYLPLKVITWEAAVKMKYEKTVDVIVEYDDDVSSPSITWKVPAVVRLRRRTRSEKKGAKFSRENVYGRDDYRCQYCAKQFPVRALSYDHVVPRAAGGGTTWENIVTCCKSCNALKANRSCDEAGMWPMTMPVRPKRLRLRGVLIDPDEAPEEWRAFIAPNT